VTTIRHMTRGGSRLRTVKHGNIFSLHAGPDRTIRLRATDARTSLETGNLIRRYGARRLACRIRRRRRGSAVEQIAIGLI